MRGSGQVTWLDNTAGNRPNFVTHLECSRTGKRHAADRLHNLSEDGYPLLVRYDLERMAGAFTRETLAGRSADLWRYREMLPVTDAANIVSLGEITTPLITLEAIAGRLGAGRIDVKDEGRLPTGSFKARGITVAISMAKELGVKRVAMPTNGNAGAALSAYASRAGMESHVFCPEDTPEINIAETGLQGGRVYRVNGFINDCGKLVGDGKAAAGWFDFSTLKEPYRIEGKKTMGLELAEQLGWATPDVIFYPTGGGTGLIGMWKAFDELEQLGWLGRERPRMVAVQAAGCAPIVKAFEEGRERAEPWRDAATVAGGHPRAGGHRRFPDSRCRARKRRFRHCRHGRGDRKRARRGRFPGGPAALSRGRGDFCGLSEVTRRRAHRPARPRGAFQLCHRPEIPDARLRRGTGPPWPYRLRSHGPPGLTGPSCP